MRSSAHSLQLSAPVHEDQVKVFVQLGLNPTIFCVSRVSLDSINRLVNIEKHTRDFGEEFTTLKEAIFWVLFFFFILFYEDD